jgi:hypothetical protein
MAWLKHPGVTQVTRLEQKSHCFSVLFSLVRVRGKRLNRVTRVTHRSTNASIPTNHFHASE